VHEEFLANLPFNNLPKSAAIPYNMGAVREKTPTAAVQRRTLATCR